METNKKFTSEDIVFGNKYHQQGDHSHMIVGKPKEGFFSKFSWQLAAGFIGVVATIVAALILRQYFPQTP